MMINALLARATILSVEFPDLLFLCFSSIKLFPEFSAGRNQAKAKKWAQKMVREKHLQNIFYYTKYLWLSCGGSGKNGATYEWNAPQLAKRSQRNQGNQSHQNNRNPHQIPTSGPQQSSPNRKHSTTNPNPGHNSRRICKTFVEVIRPPGSRGWRGMRNDDAPLRLVQKSFNTCHNVAKRIIQKNDF